MLLRMLSLFVIAVGGSAIAQVNPNAGAFTAEGYLNDHDGNRGSWAAKGELTGGKFTGILSMQLAGKVLNVTMDQAYAENGFCVLRGIDGRSRFELRGKCSPSEFGPGVAKGYFDGDRDFTGEFTGAIHWGAAVGKPIQTGTVPKGKLMCIYRERIGGVVAGDLGYRYSHPSAMVSLTMANGTYTTRNSSGRYVVKGDRAHFTSGAFAGAVGELRTDNSGAPAVYFNLEENRGPDGRPIVDPWTTACASQN